jgi:hypothetical protein
MLTFLNTRAAARLLGRNANALHYLIQNDYLAEPQKDASGNYLWFPEDIERARAALAIDRRKLPRKPTAAAS